MEAGLIAVERKSSKRKAVKVFGRGGPFKRVVQTGDGAVMSTMTC